ncbi:predicted protein [Naegleria gruberi]|uniref:Predicted protein n=1 Tax=Naegleria gruberi TaxID=5762 RepID=D2VBM4_NAEGR|nr:uncharacterized protein NAEGRDRAFT_66267 [Naegleria gruberi]EFC45934.1 predicted protein [Naegleria gruberi]|eukprot:XP_002678678.1 predicted protein [Naegleria gruberi strain NEG-M]
MRAVSKKTHKVIEMLMISINVVFIFVSSLLILAASILYGIKNFEIVPTSTMTYIFPVFAVIVFFMFAFVISMVISSGVLVIRNIRKTTQNVTQSIQKNNHSNSSVRISLETQTFEKRVQSPFKITIGLMIGLVLCILLEIISVSLAAGVTAFEEIKAVWHFFNCLGVLIYSVLVLFLFYPLFLDSEKALNEIEKRNEIVKSSTTTKTESLVSTPVAALFSAASEH